MHLKLEVVRVGFAYLGSAWGNLLALQRILGHSSITVIMRYSHLAPDHSQDALALNPLVAFDISSTHNK